LLPGVRYFLALCAHSLTEHAPSSTEVLDRYPFLPYHESKRRANVADFPRRRVLYENARQTNS
jgi:hypothetical protein